MKELTPSQVKNFIITALKIHEIPYVAGPPGIGKSDIHEQIAKEFNLKLLDIRLSQMLPEDLTGLPSLNDNTGKAEYNPFDTFPMKDDKIPDGYDGWLVFLDELSSASEEVMAAIYSLLLGHTVGGKKLHSKALIAAAGNRSTDSAIARPLPDTLITRLLPCEMKVASKDWITWGKSANINESILNFIGKYPDMLLGTVPAEKKEELETYATPRGWGKVSKLIDLHEKNPHTKITKKDSYGVPIEVEDASGEPIEEDIKVALFAAVGVMAGQAYFEHYNETMQIPYPWDVAQSPTSTRIPSAPVGKAKLTTDLAKHFIDTAEQSRDAILIFMNRMEKEYSALFLTVIEDNLGSTTSDLRMISDIGKRLNVESINTPKE